MQDLLPSLTCRNFLYFSRLTFLGLWMNTRQQMSSVSTRANKFSHQCLTLEFPCPKDSAHCQSTTVSKGLEVFVFSQHCFSLSSLHWMSTDACLQGGNIHLVFHFLKLVVLPGFQLLTSSVFYSYAGIETATPDKECL